MFTFLIINVMLNYKEEIEEEEQSKYINKTNEFVLIFFFL